MTTLTITVIVASCMLGVAGLAWSLVRAGAAYDRSMGLDAEDVEDAQ